MNWNLKKLYGWAIFFKCPWIYFKELNIYLDFTEHFIKNYFEDVAIGYVF